METSIEKISCITIRCDVTRKLGKDQNYKTRYQTLIPHLAIKGFRKNIDRYDTYEISVKKAIRALQLHHCAINYYTVKALIREIRNVRFMSIETDSIEKRPALSKQYFKGIIRELGLNRDTSSGIACFYWTYRGRRMVQFFNPPRPFFLF